MTNDVFNNRNSFKQIRKRNMFRTKDIFIEYIIAVSALCKR